MEMAQNEGRHSETFDALASELRLTLVSSYETLGAQVNGRLQHVGLVAAWFNVLMILRDSATGRLSMGEIADLTLASPRNVTALVDSLEDAGLVRRHASRSDRRVTLIGLTRAGEELLDAFLPGFYGAIGRFFDSFSEEEKLQLIHGLNKLRQAMAHANAAEQPPAVKKPVRSAAARTRPGGRSRPAAGARGKD
jgi:DNA-binding MarR family transcriptional regulator